MTRYQVVDYNRLHRMAEVIFRMCMTRQRCYLKESKMVEGPRRNA